MKNKRIFKLLPLVALMLAAILCLSSCGTKSTPKADDASGTIEGTAIDWKFTSSDNTLEISGIGAIPNFESANNAPWADAMASIKVLEVESGITKIGDRALYGATALETIKLADTVAEIGDLSFAFCSALTKVSLGESITSVGYAAFEGCSKLETFETGKSITSLGEKAFAFCSSLKLVRLLSATEIKAQTFYNCRALSSLVLDAGITAEMVDENAFLGTEFTFENRTAYSSEPVKVTVKYVFEDGSEAAAAFDKEYSVGTPYTAPSPTVEGYEASELTITGIASVGGNEHTVTYKKVVEETTEPAETEAPTTEEPTEPNYLALVIMIVVLAGVGVGAFFLMKSNKKNEEQAKNQNKAKNRKQK